jgi:predicted nucleic acid-binding Zn ribbon protein
VLSRELEATMTSPSQRGPKPLSEILGELFAARGYGRLRATSELEEAWRMVVGEAVSELTQVGAVRQGVLSVTVAHSALLEELAAFQKSVLLAGLRERAPGTPIRDIRFRIGPVGDRLREAPGSDGFRSEEI